MVTSPAFAFSRFKKETPHLSSWLPCNQDTHYRLNTKWAPDVMLQVLQLINLVRLAYITKMDLYGWLCPHCLVNLCTIFRTNIKWEPDLWYAWKNLYSTKTIFLFHIKCNLMQFIQKTVDVSHTSCVRVWVFMFERTTHILVKN